MRIFFTLSFAALLLTACVVTPSNSPVSEENASSSEFSSERQRVEPVVVYAEDLGWIESSVSDRSWQKIGLWKKVGNKSAEQIGKFGAVGEYASSFILDADKKIVYINLESSIVALNIQTKEVKTVFTPKKAVIGMSLSPDQTKLFIWDQIYASFDDSAFFAHVFDMKTGKDEIVLSGSGQKVDSKFAIRTKENSQPDVVVGFLFPQVWRSDDTVILSEGKGEGSALWSFDLSSHQLSDLQLPVREYALNESGTLIAIPNSSITSPCNVFSGDETNSIKIMDPLTQKVFGIIGNSENSKNMKVIGFSPDDKQMLYSRSVIPADMNKCNELRATEYFIVTIATLKNRKVDDVDAVRREWNLHDVGARIEYRDGATPGLEMDGMPVSSSGSIDRIVDQYYE